MTLLTRIPIEQRALKKAWTNSSISCFCCRDSGLVIDYVAACYLIEDYSRFDVPVLCQREACKARYIWLDFEGGQRQVVRFSPDWVDTRASPGTCEQIHQQELTRIKEAGEMAQEDRDRLRSVLTHPEGILGNLPATPGADGVDF